MGTFLFMLKDKRAGHLTRTLLERHVEHLKELQRSGHLVLCGPLSDNVGALQVLRASSREDAVARFEADPFLQDQYYRAYDCHEFSEANEANGWLVASDQTRSNMRE